MEEAAVVDGANAWQRFWRICVPQVKGVISVVAIFAFVGSWNDFLWPLIILTSEQNYTLTVGLNYLRGTFYDDPRLIAADRKSTRLNSSHVAISYAVFC